MREHTLIAKLNEYHFGMPKVEYLGNYISSQGVETNLKKIETISQWPQPKTQIDLGSFLGLTGYYKMFIKGYAHICRPLTALLKKDGFNSEEEATTAFRPLKGVMTTTPILAPPNFDLTFEGKTYALGYGIGVIPATE